MRRKEKKIEKKKKYWNIWKEIKTKRLNERKVQVLKRERERERERERFYTEKLGQKR